MTSSIVANLLSHFKLWVTCPRYIFLAQKLGNWISLLLCMDTNQTGRNGFNFRSIRLVFLPHLEYKCHLNSMEMSQCRCCSTSLFQIYSNKCLLFLENQLVKCIWNRNRLIESTPRGDFAFQQNIEITLQN